MVVSVGVYWVVVEFTARLQKFTPAFPGENRIGYVALAAGMIVASAASIVRRSMLAVGPADAGARIQVASIVYPLFVVALAAHAVYFPRWSQWEEWARAVGATRR